MKQALFVTFDLIRENEPQNTLSIASILAYLKNDTELKSQYIFHHNSVNMLSLLSPISKIFFKDFTIGYNLTQLEFILVSAYVWNEYMINDYVAYLKANGFQGKIILGGYQITYANEGKLKIKYPNVDFFIIGYAEESLKQYFISEGNVLGNSLKLSIDFNLLPSPYLHNEILINENVKTIRWETKRGCPYKCSFCAHTDTTHKKVYKKPNDRILDELQLFATKKLNKVNVLDPIFNMQDKYLSILQKINYLKMNTAFSLQTRLELLDDENHFLNEISKGNYILECGLQTMIEEESKLIDRKNNLDKIKVGLKQLVNRNIKHEISLIYGLPNQTLDSFKYSIDKLNKLGINNIVAFPLMLLAGTKMFSQKAEFKIQEEIIGDFNIPVVTSSNSFTKNDWLKMNKIAEQLKPTNRY
jgi:radical SAM superfamily enzyme YgiQ (UPF0313 family)